MVVALLFSGCGKLGSGCANNTYFFEILIKAYPDKDSIRIGDTIHFEISSPTNFKDLRSGDNVDFRDSKNLGASVSFTKVISSTQVEGSTSRFNYLLTKGRVVESLKPDAIRSYLFDEENDKYVFKLAISPKEKGLYNVVFNKSVNVYRTRDECTKATFLINFANTNQHYYLHPNIGNASDPSGVYLFKVY